MHVYTLTPPHTHTHTHTHSCLWSHSLMMMTVVDVRFVEIDLVSESAVSFLSHDEDDDDDKAIGRRGHNEN